MSSKSEIPAEIVVSVSLEIDATDPIPMHSSLLANVISETGGLGDFCQSDWPAV